MKKFGYVLSGGGARGFAHLGILEYLEELNIKPYAISGTSAGAIAGALYAAGKTPTEILHMVKNNSYFGWSNMIWKKPGFFSMQAFEKVLKDAITEDSFEALKIKLFVAATDLNKGESVIFSEGKLFQQIIASASLPVIFAPVTIGERILVDGGLLNNFPIEPLENICDVIIGSYVNKLEKGIGKNSVIGTFNIIERCFLLATAHAVYSKAHRCDVFIETPVNSFSMYDVKNADAIFEAGYKTALQHKEALHKLCDQ